MGEGRPVGYLVYVVCVLEGLFPPRPPAKGETKTLRKRQSPRAPHDCRTGTEKIKKVKTAFTFKEPALKIE